MISIKWAKLAQRDLFDIDDYFTSKGEKEVGEQIAIALINATRRLIRNPLSGRIGRLNGTREIVIRKYRYILVYRIIAEDKIEILRAIHTSRFWPKSLSNEN